MNELTIVCEHSTVKTVDNLKTVIEHAKNNKLQFIKPEQLTLFFDNKLDGNYLLLTFDDGLEFRYSEIPILLREHNIKALSFIFPMNAGMHEMFTNFNFYISNKDVFEIGCHSLTHSMICISPNASSKEVTVPKSKYYGCASEATYGHGLINKEYNLWTKKYETDLQYLIRMEHELCFSKDWIERAIGKPCNLFAYPYGVYNKQLVDLVINYGYSMAFSMTQTNYNRFNIPRLYIKDLNQNLKLHKFDKVGVKHF